MELGGRGADEFCFEGSFAWTRGNIGVVEEAERGDVTDATVIQPGDRRCVCCASAYGYNVYGYSYNVFKGCVQALHLQATS